MNVGRIGHPFEPAEGLEREAATSLHDLALQGLPLPGGFDSQRAGEAVDEIRTIADIGQFRVSPPMWTLECDNEQTHELVATVGSLTGTVTAIL